MQQLEASPLCLAHMCVWLQVTATSSKNADLLAAMRGGGTVFGVVTKVAFKVYDVSDYHGGVITYEDDTNCTALRSGLHTHKHIPIVPAAFGSHSNKSKHNI